MKRRPGSKPSIRDRSAMHVPASINQSNLRKGSFVRIALDNKAGANGEGGSAARLVKEEAKVRF